MFNHSLDRIPCSINCFNALTSPPQFWRRWRMIFNWMKKFVSFKKEYIVILYVMPCIRQNLNLEISYIAFPCGCIYYYSLTRQNLVYIYSGDKISKKNILTVKVAFSIIHIVLSLVLYFSVYSYIWTRKMSSGPWR